MHRAAPPRERPGGKYALKTQSISTTPRSHVRDTRAGPTRERRAAARAAPGPPPGKSSVGRSHTIMRGRCSMRDIGVRKRSMRMSASSLSSDCNDRAAPHDPLGNHIPLPASGTQRCPRGLEAAIDVLEDRRPLAVATFRWPPVSSGTCAGRRGVLHGRLGGGSVAGAAPGKSMCAAHRSGNREASARTRCARMACRVQCRASVSWRCLEMLGTPTALMPAAWRRE